MIGKKHLLGSNVITQIGIVVKDIEKSSEDYAKFFGVGKPSIHLTDTVEKAHTEYRGEPTTAQAKLAFFKFKNITVELIEPVGGPSTWQEFLDTKGEGVHHIAFNVRGSKEKIEAMAGQGMSLVQAGDTGGGGRYSYVDATDALKVIIELLGR
jgi:hypothetical protein